MPSLTEIVWKASTVATALVAARMIWLALWKTYPKIFAYLVVVVLGSIVLMFVPPRSTMYGVLYIIFQSVNVLSAMLAVVELYRQSLAEREALATYARGVASYVLMAAVVVLGLGAILDSDVPPGQSAIVHHYLTFERSMDLAIVLLLLVIAVFLTWFPVKLKRNVILLGVGFFVFYSARASGLLVTNLVSTATTDLISDIMLAISTLCMMYWLISMRREAEDVDTTTGISRDPARLEALTRQLDAINAALSRFGRTSR